MVEFLNTCYQGLISGSEVLIGWAMSFLSWGGDLIVHFDVNYPRTAGLVLGITLTWLMLRRERHPFIRAISGDTITVFPSNINALSW